MADRGTAAAPAVGDIIGTWVASGRYADADAVMRAALAALAREEERRREPSDDILRSLFQARVMGFAIIDLASGRTLAINDYALSLAGTTRAAFERGTWDWTWVTPPEQVPRDLEALEQVRERGWCDPYEKEWLTPDGVRIPVRISGAALSGEPPRAIVYVEDLRERRQAEALLRRSEARLDLAVRAHGIGIFDWDVQTGELVWSEQEKRIFGVEMSGFGGHIDDWGAHVLPDDRVRMEAGMAAAMARGDAEMAFAFRIRRPDGALRHVEGSGRFLYAADGTPLRMIGINIDATERVEAEEAVRESRSLLQALFEAAPLHTGVVEERGENLAFLLTNRATALALGQGEGGLAGRTLSDIGLNASEIADWRRVLVRCHEATRPLTLEFPVHRDGREVGWYLGTFSPLPPGREGRRRTSFVAIAITELKRTAEALRESEARLRSVADNLPNGLIYQVERDPDGTQRFTYLSGAVERLHGVTAAAAMADFDLLDRQVLPEFRPTLDAARHDAAERGITIDIEIPMLGPSGAIRWFRRTAAPRVLPSGVQVWDGVEIDVTERRQAAEAARARSHELETVLATVPAAVWFTHDPQVREVARNRYASELMGVDVGSGASFGSDRLPHVRLMRDGVPVAPADMPLQRAMRGDEATEEEYAFVFEDGRVHTLLSSSASLLDEAGRIVGAVSVGLDITERKRAEEHRTLLIHELNHRVKNTLATVQAIAMQSLRAAETPEAARERFTSRLMALAKAHDILTRESWEGANLDDVVEGAIAPHRPDGRGRFDVAGPPVRLSPALALSAAMALHELGTNAAKYGALSGEEGRVAVTWDMSDGTLRLVWRESGGPPVTPPSRRGFGTRLIERGLAAEPDGEVRLDFARTGLVCTMAAHLAPGDASVAGAPA